jgi:hypothetical protein
MQTYHGETTINPQGEIVLALPFPKGQRVEIVARPILTTAAPEPTEGEAWERMSLDAFFAGYAEEDSIYDKYHEWRKNTGSGMSS